MDKLEKYRQDGTINVSKIIEQNKFEIDLEKSGARQKFWFDNHQYLFKAIFPGSYEDYAEVIAEEIAKQFGIPCAEYDLAVFEGKKGVVTKNFLQEDEVLITGSEIIEYIMDSYVTPIEVACIMQKKRPEVSETTSKDEKKTYINNTLRLMSLCNIDYGYANEIQKILAKEDVPDYEDKLDDIILRLTEAFKELEFTYQDLFQRKQEKKWKWRTNNLFELTSMIDIYIKKLGLGGEETSIRLNNELYNIFINDILMLQGDRHCSNWGIIVNWKTKSVRMAPLFDNSNLYNLNRSKVVANIEERIESEKKERNPQKKSRKKASLRDSIYHPTPRLTIDEETRNSYIKQVIQFAKTYSSEDLNRLEKKLMQFDDASIDFIFTSVQSKIKQEIPETVKQVVTESIKINRDTLLEIISQNKGERVVNANAGKN